MEASKQYTTPTAYNDQALQNKARNDKFIIVLNIPEPIRNIISTSRNNKKIDFDSLQFSVYGYPMPNVIVPAVGQMYGGHELKVSSHTKSAYDNITVDFDVDNNYKNWWVIYTWLDLLSDERNATYNYKNLSDEKPNKAFKEYTATFTIYGLDLNNNKVIRFDYEGCVPVSLTSPKYNDRDTAIMKAGFEFGFTFFTPTLI